MGAYEEAPQRGADTGTGHAMSFPLHLSTSKQRLSVAPFYLGLHVPFRIQAVIKILTFRVLFSHMF